MKVRIIFSCNSQSTSDAYIHFGSGAWCHVLCSELIQQTQFLNNNMILSHLLLAFSAEGLQIPQTISAQKRLISTTKIYCILPSNIVVINPPQSFPNYKLICSICNKEINGRFVQCWYVIIISSSIVLINVLFVLILSVQVIEKDKSGVSLSIIEYLSDSFSVTHIESLWFGSNRMFKSYNQIQHQSIFHLTLFPSDQFFMLPCM